VDRVAIIYHKHKGHETEKKPQQTTVIKKGRETTFAETVSCSRAKGISIRLCASKGQRKKDDIATAIIQGREQEVKKGNRITTKNTSEMREGRSPAEKHGACAGEEKSTEQ